LHPRRLYTPSRFWTDTWNPLLELDPQFFESYANFSSFASHSRTFEPKYREIVVCAFDAATTHLYGGGTRMHMRNALKLGATPDELMEMLEITSLVGIDGVTTGALEVKAGSTTDE
jgi:alkylhydroperoxidase/carboxymuconolactone decarboxylase family protein YurZ